MRSGKFILGICSLAVAVSAESLLVLPVSGHGKTEDAATVNQLYHDALEARFKGRLVIPPESTAPCANRECAVQLARELNADSAIYSSLNQLGSKWIFSSSLVYPNSDEVFNQRLTALSIEDMEAVTQRMADAILTHKDLEQVATLDNITEKETDQEPGRRRSIYSTGLGVGYIFPTTRGDFNDTVINLNSSYTPIIRLAWLNNWQFNNSLLLNTDLLVGIGAEVGGDANLDYLFNRGDYSPFIGGGLGMHYVFSEETGRSSGVALNAQGGIMLFRTYDINVMLRGYYQIILNSNYDKGAGFDLDLTYHNSHPEKKEASSGGGLFSGIAAGIGYTVLGLLLIGMISAASH